MTKDRHSFRKDLILKRTIFSRRLPANFSIKEAEESDLEEVCHFIYTSYVEEGYIEKNPLEIRMRQWDISPFGKFFIARINKQIIGVIEYIQFSPQLRLPSFYTFFHYMYLLNTIYKEGNFGEVSSVVVDKKYRNTGVFGELVRCVMSYIFSLSQQYIVVQISPAHEFFYETLLFEKMIGPHFVQMENTGPVDYVILMGLSLENIEERVKQLDQEIIDDYVSIFERHPEEKDVFLLYDFFFKKNKYLNVS